MAVAAAASESPAQGELDAFVSYSHRDRSFVLELKRALERRGRNVWIDADDIPAGATWRSELGTAIEAADAFVFVISPDSVASAECGEELERATELGKRMVPVLLHSAPMPAALAAVQYVDVTGDADLERSLDELDRAIATDHDWVREHTRWLARALSWNAGARNRSGLLRGSELNAAEAWLARQAEGKQPPPTRLQTEYVVASRAAERRRLRTIVGLTLVALAVSVALGALAFVSRNEAVEQRDQARSRELAARAVTQVDVDPERSILLALEAEQVTHSGPAEDALRRALVQSHLRVVMAGHRRAVSDLDLTADGERLVSASRDGTARIFEPGRGRLLRVLRGHGRPIATASFAPDGRTLATASDDGTARMWDVASGRTLAILRHDGGQVRSAAFDRDGHRLVTAGGDGTARVWHAASGRQLVVLRGHRGGVARASFSPDGRSVLTAGRDGTARLWNADSGRGRVLAAHDAPLFLAEFSPYGRLVLSADFRGKVRVWKAGGGRVSELPGMAFTATFSPDGRSVATTTIDGAASIWNARTGERETRLLGHGSPVTSATYSPDGGLIATGGQDHTGRVWDASQGTQVAVLRGRLGTVGEVAFTPDGRSLITGTGDGSVRRWDTGAGVVLRGHGGGQVTTPGRVNTVEASPDGRTVLTAATDATARLWDAHTGREIVRPGDCGLRASSRFSCLSVGVALSHQSFIEAATFSPDGRRVATAGRDGTAFVFEPVSGRKLATFRGHEGSVWDVAFGPDGDRVVTAGGDGTARVWDARSGEQVALLRGHGGEVYAATFMPGGRRVVTSGSDGTVRLWDTGDGRSLRTFRLARDGIEDVAVSPDGHHLAAPVGESARVWDARTGRTVTVVREHDGLVFTAAFSPDGRALVTGGEDLTARLWELPGGRSLGVLRGHGEYLHDARFTPDGRSVLTAADDGTARIVPCDACGSVDALIARARRRVTRTLSPAERRQFLTQIEEE